MSTGCPICDEPIHEPAPHCPTCGFPTALAPDALRALAEPDALSRSERPGPPEPTRAPARASGGARDSQSESCNRVALELRANLTLLQQLGGESHEVTSEMNQAALIQADGRVGEALSLLRDAQSRVVLHASELFERRLKELRQRQEALGKDGVGVDYSADFEKMHSSFDAARRPEAMQTMLHTDQALTRVESDWRGLRGLLQQIDTLREATRGSGREVPEVEEDLTKVRQILKSPTLDAEALDTAAQTAARALMLLHEALPPVLEQELDRQGQVLNSFPNDVELGRRGRAIHAEASRHLRRGRLAEASARLRELRSVIRDLGTPPLLTVPGPETEAVPDDGAADSGDAGPRGPVPSSPNSESPDPLGRLLQKARGLAARVRTLPPESDVAFEAAAEIRRATELLRARKLDEADSTLTRLMRTLDAEHPAEA